MSRLILIHLASFRGFLLQDLLVVFKRIVNIVNGVAKGIAKLSNAETEN